MNIMISYKKVNVKKNNEKNKLINNKCIEVKDENENQVEIMRILKHVVNRKRENKEKTKRNTVDKQRAKNLKSRGIENQKGKSRNRTSERQKTGF